MSVGVLGGAFDPPHNGHVALARAAQEQLRLGRLLVVVVAEPGHKDVHCPPETRLRLARAAFPDDDVQLDGHARTIDLLRERRLDDPVLILGADELVAFPTWKEPGAVLELARLAVGARPGYPRELVEAALAELDRPDRVLFFELEPLAVSSTEIRARVRRGESIDDLVPPAVAVEIARAGLYREHPGYTGKPTDAGDLTD